LWAPVTNKAGSKQEFYTNLTKMKRGERFYSNVGGKIVAVGVVMQEAVDCKNPLNNHKEDWIQDGWLVRVEYAEVDTPVDLKAHIDRIRPLLPKKHRFIWPDGRLPQGGYVFAISDEMAQLLSELGGNQFNAVTLCEDAAEEGIRGRTDIPRTEVERLVKSRRGQGRYRTNVLKNETACRITGVTDPRLLIASHIKPWVKCSDSEKLDGCNGLMLTPNADKLFDRGHISFGDDGTLLVSPGLSSETLLELGINPEKNVGRFSVRQCEYLDYHRGNIFRA
jgi:putative restriction endonuclease